MTNTKNTATETATAPGAVYYPRAKVESAEEWRVAQTINAAVKSHQRELSNSIARVTNLEKELQNHVDAYERAVMKSSPTAAANILTMHNISELKLRANQLCVESNRALVNSIEMSSKWVPGTKLCAEASKAGVNFSVEDTNAVAIEAQELDSLNEAAVDSIFTEVRKLERQLPGLTFVPKRQTHPEPMDDQLQLLFNLSAQNPDTTRRVMEFFSR